MKNEKHKKWLGLFVLFLEFFGILFVGFCICNAMAVAIDCMFEGFGSFWGRILDLPFLLYLCFSFVISIVLTIVMQNKITLLLVVLTPAYTTFSRSFTCKNTHCPLDNGCFCNDIRFLRNEYYILAKSFFEFCAD